MAKSGAERFLMGVRIHEAACRMILALPTRQRTRLEPSFALAVYSATAASQNPRKTLSKNIWRKKRGLSPNLTKLFTKIYNLLFNPI